MKLSLILPIVLVSCAAAQAIFTDIQVACQGEALATSIIPTGTPASVVAADIELACDIATTFDSDVQKVVTAWEAAQSDAGVSPVGGTYTPSPMATHKRKAKP